MSSPAGDFGLAGFLEAVAELRGVGERPLFDRGKTISVARAPGRLDVMGGVADYSGSLVLQMPIHEAAFAAVQLHDGKSVDVLSLAQDGASPRTFGRADVTRVVSYAEEREFFASASDGWPAYVLGAFSVLAHERGARFATGVRICIGSTVPEGRGVASSAAVEVCVMSALADAYGLSVCGRELALLCHLLENEIVGVPCGPMDQFAVALGEESRLLALLCRPAEQLDSVEASEDVVIVGVDSGANHSNAGRAYRRARAAAFMGKHILERHRPLAYLTELTPSDLIAQERRLPASISGAEFLGRYGPLTDSGTFVEPREQYPVRAAVRHAVDEHQRVHEFAHLLPRAHTHREFHHLGALLNLAHRGYDACGLGSPATDDLATSLQAVPGVYGARVSGGGSGGTVVALARAGAVGAIADMVREQGRTFFSGSSPGSQEFGTRRILLPD